MQHFKLIKPIVGSDKNSLTEVRSFSADTPGVSVDELTENIYTILTVWAPASDIQQIMNHVFEVFTSTFYEDMDAESIELRYKRAIKEVNSGIKELNSYYSKQETRFHLEGVVAVVSKDIMVSSISGNDARIYKKSGVKISSIHNDVKSSNMQNIFSPTYGTKLEQDDEVMLISPRFSDHVPKTLLHDFIKSNSDNSFREFREKVHALKSGHLGAVWINSGKNQETEEVTKNTNPEPQIKRETARTMSEKLVVLFNKLKVSLVSIWGVVVTKILKPLVKIMKNAWNLLWSKYINPNPLASLIVVGVVLAVILGIFMFNTWYNPRTQVLNKSYLSIQQDLDRAKSEISNGQKTDALQSLTNLNNKIDSIPTKDQTAISSKEKKSNKPTLEDIKHSIALLIDQVQDISRVKATQVYKSPSDNSKYTSITGLADLIYCIDKTSGEIISINKGGSVKTVATSKDLKNISSLTSSTSLNALYALSDSGLYQIKPDGVVTKQNSSSTAWPNSVAIAAYLQNIYLLGSDDNQIYRFTKTASGFGPRSSYIKKPASELLSGATALTVNGKIFVAKSNGSVLMFELGEQQDFNISKPPADLSDISAIAYLEDENQLILLNPNKNAFILLQLRDGGADYLRELVVNGTSPIYSFIYDKTSKNVFYTSTNSVGRFPI